MGIIFFFTLQCLLVLINLQDWLQSVVNLRAFCSRVTSDDLPKCRLVKSIRLSRLGFDIFPLGVWIILSCDQQQFSPNKWLRELIK